MTKLLKQLWRFWPRLKNELLHEKHTVQNKSFEPSAEPKEMLRISKQMEFLTIVTIGFLLLEATNVIVLYLFPSSKYANAVGIFKAWEKSKDDPEIYNFVKYLVNWVAGTKLIFIALLVVILVVADDHTLIVAGAALVVSIASFFWRLRPLICQMDKEGQIEPENYSQTLTWMIGAFILVFVSGIIISLSS